MNTSWLRMSASVLLLASGLIDIPYGWFFVAGYASYVWYAMGAVYIFTGGFLAMNLRPRAIELWALVYTLFLLSAWITGGYRDWAAYADKVVEILLAVNLITLIRNNWPSMMPKTSP